MTSAKKPGFYGYVIVMACFVMMLVLWGTFNTFGIFLKPLLQELGASRAVTSAPYAISGVLLALFGIPIARWSQKYSPQLVIALCGVTLGSGYFLLSMVRSLWQLYLFYGVFVAVGMGAYIAVLPIIARWFVKRVATMTGVVFSGMGFGIMIVPPLVSPLIESRGWEFAYIVVGIIALVGIVGGAMFLRRDPRQMGQVPYGMSQAEYDGPHHATEVSIKGALGTRQFWLVSGIYFIFLFCQLAIMVHIVIHAIYMNIPAVTAANIFIAIGLMLIVGMNVIGTVADRTSNKLGFVISFAIMVVAFILLLSARSLGMLYLFGVLAGFSWGGMQILYSPITAELFGLQSHGVILAAAATMGGLGAAVGPVMAGSIYDATQSYQLAFIICTVLAVVGLAMAIALTPLRQPKKNL